MSAVHMDYSVLTTLQDVMEDEYLTLIDVFLKDSDLRMALLRQAVLAARLGGASLDFVELGLAAHSFKGSSSNMGAVWLSELCRQLEEQARHQIVEGLQALVESINGEYLIIRRLFDAEREVLVAQASPLVT